MVIRGGCDVGYCLGCSGWFVGVVLILVLVVVDGWCAGGCGVCSSVSCSGWFVGVVYFLVLVVVDGLLGWCMFWC